LCNFWGSQEKGSSELEGKGHDNENGNPVNSRSTTWKRRKKTGTRPVNSELNVEKTRKGTGKGREPTSKKHSEDILKTPGGERGAPGTAGG